MFTTGTNGSFVASLFNMTADIYVQQNVQDPNTGAIVRQWNYDRTVQCKIDPVKAKGTSSRSDNKVFSKGSDQDYDEKMQLRMYCFELLSKRWRIQNIRTSSNEQVFVEIDKYDQPDTTFEVTGSHAILDPFGKIGYYEAVLVRTEVQDDTQA